MSNAGYYGGDAPQMAQAQCNFGPPAGGNYGAPPMQQWTSDPNTAPFAGPPGQGGPPPMMQEPSSYGYGGGQPQGMPGQQNGYPAQQPISQERKKEDEGDDCCASCMKTCCCCCTGCFASCCLACIGCGWLCNEVADGIGGDED